MFGFKRRKAAAGDMQIPYQVYETVNEPDTRRRRLMIRLVVALLVVTLLVGAFVLWRRSQDEQAVAPSGVSQQFQQSPQTNPQLPEPSGEPASTPLSGATYDRTVDQPQ